MTDSDYPDDIQFAGLVQAATAAADEQTRTIRQGKRKRPEEDDGSLIDPSITTDEPPVNLQNSATVLFREPSAKSKKYSRPPLGRVYASLELAPEVFLRFQNSVRKFMLDPAHPERTEVVGHRRNSGGTEVAKLKLWNCVEEFLQDDDNGERYFGRDANNTVPGIPTDRTMFWPEDSQKIIKACMPLMRKMVTNERQRLYAAESRKPKETQDSLDQESTPQKEQIDESSVMQNTGQQNGIQETTSATQPPARIPTPVGSVVLHVNLMASGGENSRRIIPRFSLSPESATNLASLRQRVKDHASGSTDKNIDHATIKVWMTDGLVEVKDDGEWMIALLSAGTIEWMDGEVRVLVEV